jgi:chromosome segregation ATPase
VFLLLVVVILRGRDKVSVYKPSILLNLVLSLIFYVAALAIHLPLLPVPEGGLAIGTLVLEVLSTATLLLLVIVVLLGADSQRGSSGEVMSFSNRMPASWEQELEFASRLIDEKEEALQRMKDETSKDSEIIASLQTKLKGAEKKEEHLLSREKEADRRLEKMARKGGRQVTLRAKVKSVQDENHAYQAEVNLLQSLQHNANQQNAAVENDIERLVGKVKKINEEKKAMRLELEHERSRTQTLQEEREKTAARITELEEEQEKHNRTIYMPAPAQECVNCKVYEAKHEHMQRSQMDATKLEDRLNAKTEEVTELQRRLREQEDLVRESRMGDKEREHLASKLLDLKREHAQCYAVAEEARRSYDQLKMSQAELTVVQRKFDESEVRVQGLTSGKIDLEKRLVELKGEVVGLNTSVKFMQDGKRGEEGIKTAQYDQMLSRETALQQEHNILKEKYSTLQSELRELEKSRYTLEGRHAEVTSKQQALDTELKSSNQTGVRVAELTSENTRVLAELSSARKEAEDAKRELERTKKVLYKKIAALKEELGTLSAELQSHKGDSRLRQELIEDARARFSSMKPLIGIEFTNSDSKGVRVTDVFPGKPADHAGIKVGDMVSSVNGEDTHTKKQFHAVMATLYPGDGVPFQVTRRHATETRVVHVSTPGLRLDEILAIRRVAHGIVQTEDLNAWKATRGV